MKKVIALSSFVAVQVIVIAALLIAYSTSAFGVVKWDRSNNRLVALSVKGADENSVAELNAELKKISDQYDNFNEDGMVTKNYYINSNTQNVSVVEIVLEPYEIPTVERPYNDLLGEARFRVTVFAHDGEIKTNVEEISNTVKLPEE
ncbi:MAG: hypothetical protein ACI4N4_06405 [Candidatus Fimenecus sp.]